jgi:hypothetical protein
MRKSGRLSRLENRSRYPAEFPPRSGPACSPRYDRPDDGLARLLLRFKMVFPLACCLLAGKLNPVDCPLPLRPESAVRLSQS